MASSSAILRRCIFRSEAAGMIRSKGFLAAYRTIASTSGVSSVESPPWLMMQPSGDGSIFRFYSLANNEIHNFFPILYNRRCESVREGEGNFRSEEFEFVGSSNGWLGLYNPESHAVLLSDPIRDRLVELPATNNVVHRLIVGEKGRLAVVTEGHGGHLSLCSPSRSNAWTPLASESACDSLTYSSKHRRLFCITRGAGNNTNLEVWDMGEGEGGSKT